MMTLNFHGATGAPGLETGGWETVRVRSPGSRGQSLGCLLRRNFPRLVLEHDRNAVLDRVAEAARLADELALRLAVEEGPLAQRADQQVEELRVQVSSQKSEVLCLSVAAPDGR